MNPWQAFRSAVTHDELYRQRAFRERKEQSLRRLEESVTGLGDRVSELQLENDKLRGLLKESRIEVETLRSVSSLPQSPIQMGIATTQNYGKVECDLPNELVLRINLRELMSGRRFSGIARSLSTSDGSVETIALSDRDV